MKTFYIIIAAIGLLANVSHAASSQLPKPPLVSPTTTTIPAVRTTTTTTVPKVVAPSPDVVRLENYLRDAKNSKNNILESINRKENYLNEFKLHPSDSKAYLTEKRRLEDDLLTQRAALKGIDSTIINISKDLDAARARQVNSSSSTTSTTVPSNPQSQKEALEAKLESFRQNAMMNAYHACSVINNNISRYGVSSGSCGPKVVEVGPNGEPTCLPPISAYDILIVSVKLKPIRLPKNDMQKREFESGTRIYGCQRGSSGKGTFVLEKTYKTGPVPAPVPVQDLTFNFENMFGNVTYKAGPTLDLGNGVLATTTAPFLYNMSGAPFNSGYFSFIDLALKFPAPISSIDFKVIF